MDFGSLLHEAKKNGKSSSNGGNFYKTKFEPPKKENKSKTLSANIQKFLAKKEEEEKQKVDDAKKRRDELLSKRDVKATNKIKKMLKVIKSANKSVLDEAVDNNDTAVTMAGPDQPDEDDYGYVSQEASAFYSKMMEKYKSIPEEDKRFSSATKPVNYDLLSTKDRVRAAIIRHQEEEAMPHKRKRRSRTTNDTSRDSHSDFEDEPEKPEEKKVEKPKPKRPAPPPLDFNQLLKIAEKKQFEPVVIETNKAEKVEETERLMTKKQKREYEQLKAFKESRLKRERERDSANSEKDPVRKPKHEPATPSKPINPLSIKIPKIGDKLNKHSSEEPKKSFNNPSTKSVDRDRPSQPKPQSGDRHRKDDLKNSDEKIDVNRNSKSSSSLSNHPKILNSLLTSKGNKVPTSSGSTFKVPSKPKESIQRNDNKSSTSENRPSTNSVSNSNRPQISSSNSSNHKITSKPSPLPNTKTCIPKGNPRDMPTNSAKTRPDQRLQKDLNISRDARSQNNTVKLDRKSDQQKPVNQMRQLPDQNRLPNRGPPQKEPIKSLNPPGKRPLALDGKAVKRKLDDGQQGSSPGPSNSKQAKPSLSDQKPRSFPPPDIKKSRQFPPPDVKGPRQFPPPDVRGPKQFPPRDMKPRKDKLKPVKGRILDSDSEYDSELDDFIDDGPQDDGNDYSKYIKEIFGYDKSRYRDADEDDTNMESNFSQVMREEYISKKIGIMEDLEDMRMEALEKKKKMQQKKRH